jgi:hypothetical protein
VFGAIFEDSNATGVDGDGADNSASESGAAYVFVVPPTAVSFSLAVTQNQPASGTLTITGAASGPLQFVLLSNGTKGTASITNASTGAFTYTPAPNATGSDAFTFAVNNSVSTSNVATVTVSITSNDAPTISQIPSATTPRNTAVTIHFTVDDDGGAAGVSVSGVSSNSVVVPSGSLTLGGTGTNRTVTITPAPNQQGVTTITLQASDGGRTATRVFTVTVGTFTPFAEQLVAAATSIKAAHIVELRGRIDALRKAQGLGGFAWSDASLAAGDVIKAVHLTELRTAIGQVYTAKNQAAPQYTDSVIVAQVTPARAAHIEELRSAVVALE